MTRLVVAELVAGLRTWAGLLLVAALSGVSVGLAASASETGSAASAEVREGMAGIAGVMWMFGGLAAIAVTAAVARLAVQLARPDYARWQLAGVTPLRVTTIVLAQLGVVGALGGLVGYLAVRALAEPLWRRTIGGGLDGVPILTGWPTAAASVGGAAVLVLVGGAFSAWSAGRGSPLAALRDVEPRRWVAGVLRWLFAALVAVGVASFVRALLAARLSPARDAQGAEAQLQTIMNSGPVLAPALAIVVVAAGPLLYPLVLRVWTGVVPARWSAAWALARHQARFHLRRSTASVTPLLVGAAMYGGLFTAARTMDRAAEHLGWETEALDPFAVLVLLGGPVALAAAGAAAVVFMSNRVTGREQALLGASGAGPGLIVLIAVLQAVIHVATSAILAAAVLGATGWILAASLSPLVPGTVTPAYEVGQPLALVAVGLLLTLVATVVPVLGRLREPLARRLAAE